MKRLAITLGLTLTITWPKIWSDEQLANTEFAVWSSPDLRVWSLAAVTTNLSYTVTNTEPVQFFRVSIAPRGTNH